MWPTIVRKWGWGKVNGCRTLSDWPFVVTCLPKEMPAGHLFNVIDDATSSEIVRIAWIKGWSLREGIPVLL